MNEQSYIYLSELEQERTAVNSKIRQIQTQQTEPGLQFGECSLPLRWQSKIDALKREERRLSRASRIMLRHLLYTSE